VKTSDGHDEHVRQRRAMLHDELAVVAEFDAQLAAQAEQRSLNGSMALSSASEPLQRDSRA
jgi:hypothetical protein